MRKGKAKERKEREERRKKVGGGGEGGYESRKLEERAAERPVVLKNGSE